MLHSENGFINTPQCFTFLNMQKLLDGNTVVTITLEHYKLIYMLLCAHEMTEQVYKILH